MKSIKGGLGIFGQADPVQTGLCAVVHHRHETTCVSASLKEYHTQSQDILSSQSFPLRSSSELELLLIDPN